jgi:hypothetical protein
MSATGFRVHFDSIHFRARIRHNYRLTTRPQTNTNFRINPSVTEENSTILNGFKIPAPIFRLTQSFSPDGRLLPSLPTTPLLFA